MGTLLVPQAVDALMVGGFPKDADLLGDMVAIGVAESGLTYGVAPTRTNPNGTVDYGVWQINSVHTKDGPGGKGTYLKDQLIQNTGYNARAAHDIYTGQGLNAWSTHKNGKDKIGPAKAAGDAARLYVKGGGVDSGNWATDSTVGKAIGGTIDAAAAVVSPFTNLTDAATKVLGVIGSADFWKRFGIGAAGFVILLVFLLILMRGEAVKTLHSVIS